jgi:hypothetical protein
LQPFNVTVPHTLAEDVLQARMSSSVVFPAPEPPMSANKRPGTHEPLIPNKIFFDWPVTLSRTLHSKFLKSNRTPIMPSDDLAMLLKSNEAFSLCSQDGRRRKLLMISASYSN